MFEKIISCANITIVEHIFSVNIFVIELYLVKNVLCSYLYE